ncbi:MAG: hypothetical protein EBX52_00910 [Proteobacteria bacterium]|nr:hypothetical protein [Pseudomonadota bacterium]
MKRFVFAALLLASVSVHARSRGAAQTVEVDGSSIEFADDLNFQDLDKAIQRQVDAYDTTIKLKGRITFGTTTFNRSVLRDSLVLFQEIAKQTAECLTQNTKPACMGRFNEAIRKRFRVFTPAAGPTRFTAYYSPDFQGALRPNDRFKVPLYSTPKDPVLRESSREDITYNGILKGLGLECAWIDADLFELYSLQIEGGGRIHLIDPKSGAITTKYITYDGKNSKSLRFFSKLMVEHGWLQPGDVSYGTQHKYFLDHPEIQRTLYAESPSYVYFSLSDEEPLGIDSIPLTERRSLAYDPAYYPVSGILNFVRLTVGGKEITRFMLGQDIGGAIKGPARADLYFGFGEEARIAAESLAGAGKQYFLIKRDAKPFSKHPK